MKVLSKKGVEKKAKWFFFFFKCVFSQKIRVKNTFLFKRRRELSEVRLKKAMKKHVEVKLAVFVLPSTCSSLCIQFWTLRWSFITVPHASRTAPRECMRGIAGKGWWTVGKEEEETHTYTNTHEMNDQCKKRKRKKKRTNKAEDPTSSQGKQMDHTSDLHTNTVSSHTIKSRSRRLVFVVSLLYQGCDSEESKTNQQLKVYAALSQQLLSFMTTLQPKTPKLYPVLHVLFWFFWLRCHV